MVRIETMRSPRILSLLLSIPILAAAQSGSPEVRAQALEKQLIAPCCWSATVAEHSSPESMQIKAEIREGIAQGLDDDAILSVMKNKYSERVLAVPKAQGFDRMIWVLPPLLFLLATTGLIVFLRRNPPQDPPEDATGFTHDPSLLQKLDDEVRKG